MIKHWQEHHGNQEQHPAFHFKIIGSFQYALTRQVNEAVRIDLRGGECSIVSLSTPGVNSQD